MSSVKSQISCKTWRKGSYYISTNSKLIPIPKLTTVYESDDFYWAKALPTTAMEEMLDNSLTFGLFETTPENLSSTSERPDESDPAANPEESLKFVGIARCVTDFVTFLYLTDVWVDPAYQGKGLGGWLIECVQTVVEDMPHLRRSLLFTGDWKRSVPFYEKLMDMKLIETRQGEGLAIMESKGRGHPSYGQDGNSYR